MAALIVIVLALGAFLVWVSIPCKLCERLGYPSDARLLIIHADDFGVCESTNAATIEALEKGVVTSASLMVPCPGFEEAAEYCRCNPEADIGVHLTFTNEYADYKWGPVSPLEIVPSLVDEEGRFYRTTEEVSEKGLPEHIELEMRAQIEKALSAGVQPTHLDSHMGVMFSPKFMGIYLRVASEYRLPAMLPGEFVTTVQLHGLEPPPRLLHKLLKFWLDATGHLPVDRMYVGGLDEVNTVQTEYYEWVVDDSAPGVNEVLVHLALDDEGARVLGEKYVRRIEDFRIMTHPATRERIASAGVTLIGYRPLFDLLRKQ